jgi:hypothetical protein
MKSKKIRESKEKIYSLAQNAIKGIYENKFLLEEISFYENHLKIIKDIFLNSTKFEEDKSKLKDYITTEISNIHNLLKTSKSNLEKEGKKLVNKIDLFNDKIFDENMPIKTEIKQKNEDNLLLTYQIKQREFQILKLNNMIKDLENSYYSLSNFKKQIKEIKVSDNVGYYYIDEDLENLTKKLNKELVYYNYNNSKIVILNSKKEHLLKKEKYFNKVIKFCEGEKLKESRLFKEDEDKNSPKKDDGKNKKKKPEFLTVSKMFDVNNEEGKEEAIIDHELHSDDEVVFEKKIKQPVKLTKDENLKKIKAIIPKVDLSQIEFNKQKVMNDDDLYSIQKREFEAQDIDQQIEEIKKQNKRSQHIRRINKKKVQALENFIKKLEYDISLLKKLKIKTSVREEFFSQKDDNNEISAIKKELNQMEVIKEDENDLEDNESKDLSIPSVDSVEDYVTYTQRSVSSDKNKNLNIKNSKKNDFSQEEVYKIKTKRNTKRRNSK